MLLAAAIASSRSRKASASYFCAKAVAPSKLTSTIPTRSNRGFAYKRELRIWPILPLPTTTTLARAKLCEEKQRRVALIFYKDQHITENQTPLKEKLKSTFLFLKSV
mmetsp:Transcript_2015/g.2965  ORF Transcript_2015/g.2965 Transcript_2015/m.2965 type:complete len:107 (-) Transcript_2015:209-529(-)